MRICKLKLNNEEYKLTLTRESVKWLEANGFSIENFMLKPITYYDLLWTSLFLTNHKNVNANLALKLLETCEKEKGKKYVSNIVKFAIEEYENFTSALADIELNENEEKLEIMEA